jgi:hypothetical protein
MLETAEIMALTGALGFWILGLQTENGHTKRKIAALYAHD